MLKYYKKIDDGMMEWGEPTYFLEVDEEGNAVRQIEKYPNGNVTSYDTNYIEDNYGALAIMVVDGDEEYWKPYEIHKSVFEEEWITHRPINRPKP